MPSVSARPDEPDWIAGLRAGDPVLAGELRDRLLRSLVKSFGRQLSPERLEDLAQASVERVLTQLDRFEGRSRFTTWATAIAVNTTLMDLRRKRYADVPLEAAMSQVDQLLERPAAPARLQRRAVDDALHHAIRTVLTEAQRDALLAELGGIPPSEIARRTGRSRGALYKLLHDARKKLKGALLDAGISPADLGEAG